LLWRFSASIQPLRCFVAFKAHEERGHHSSIISQLQSLRLRLSLLLLFFIFILEQTTTHPFLRALVFEFGDQTRSWTPPAAPPPRSAAPNKRSVYRKSTLKLWVLSRRRSCRVRAPFFADFASGRRPISKKPIAGFVTAREHLCDKIPHEKPPRHTTRHCGTGK
jgi:hypothetical protein